MLANMWYDKYPGIPPRRSPLESLFAIVYMRRHEAKLLETRAIIESTLPEGAAAKPAIAAYQQYHDRMMPFIEAALKPQNEAHEMLKEFVKRKAKIDVRPYLNSQADIGRRNAIRRAGRIRPRVPGSR